MSFEGYHQILCKKGHYIEIDVYMHSNGSFVCDICGEGVGWVNLVDQTNVEEVGKVKLKEIGEDHIPCHCCGGTGLILTPRFEIPHD